MLQWWAINHCVSLLRWVHRCSTLRSGTAGVQPADQSPGQSHRVLWEPGSWQRCLTGCAQSAQWPFQVSFYVMCIMYLFICMYIYVRWFVYLCNMCFFVSYSRSHIGKAILSQPACVSKLLSLLLDQRPSPKLVLIILQLCRAALPLMSVEDCGNVALPSWSYSINTLDAEQQDASDPASRIAALLLAKLADYVVPGWSLFFPRSAKWIYVIRGGC